MKQIPDGNPFGSHRVLEPKGVLPQPARKLDNDMSRIWDNEILLDVDTLNVDSASFTQIKKEAGGDVGKIKAAILAIVADRGKMQNPVTGSGGMFMGKVAAVGAKLADRKLAPGDGLVSLVSLSLTPLKIDEIVEVKPDIDQVVIKGQAILFESGIYAKLPDDLPPALALAALDVCGAPAQTAKLVRPGDTVVIFGATGKSGMLCAYEATKRAGITGRVIGFGRDPKRSAKLIEMGLCHDAVRKEATDALGCYEEVRRLTGGRMADLVINCVNVPDTEMASILSCREGGTVYFFSMATSFTKAALGAEGTGRDVTMIIGNGYSRGHAEITLNVLRECPPLRALYESLYK